MKTIFKFLCATIGGLSMIAWLYVSILMITEPFAPYTTTAYGLLSVMCIMNAIVYIYIAQHIDKKQTR